MREGEIPVPDIPPASAATVAMVTLLKKMHGLS